MEATALDQEDLVYWVQIGRFEQPAVQGVPVTRAIGYRDRRLLHPNIAPAVFIDARNLGRSLCCRILGSAFQTVWSLLALIEVDLPAGVQPEWVGGRDVPGSPGWRTFAHCSTIVLWGRFREVRRARTNLLPLNVIPTSRGALIAVHPLAGPCRHSRIETFLDNGCRTVACCAPRPSPGPSAGAHSGVELLRFGDLELGFSRGRTFNGSSAPLQSFHPSVMPSRFAQLL